ncbi:glycerophosphoryl diester phosphodiesterase [Streptosporangium violaceochromogenes]|nr:glycerophosphoryl diester phosphodiesterase [Streptosporangium violaceochromogenes]
MPSVLGGLVRLVGGALGLSLTAGFAGPAGLSPGTHGPHGSPGLFGLSGAAGPAPSILTRPGNPANPAGCGTGEDDRGPIVVAHRGASAFRPEHTIPAYEAAVRMGADYVEPDVVPTKDHVLVVRHENELSRTTDVRRHPEFAGRRTTKIVDGVRRTGWFTEDFTLDELRTLGAVERFAALRPASAVHDGLAPIPTLDEVVGFAREAGVGVYVEIKHSTYFASIGLPIEGPLLAVLTRHGWNDWCAPVFVQSFETGNLARLRPLTRVRLTQLIKGAGAPYDLVAAGDGRTYDDMVTPEGLGRVAEYADAITVATSRVAPYGPGGAPGVPTSLVRDAHARGLQVHVATVRNENTHLPREYRQGDPADPEYPRARGDVAGWLERLYRLGVDGVFADDPEAARLARDRVRLGTEAEGRG